MTPKHPPQESWAFVPELFTPHPVVCSSGSTTEYDSLPRVLFSIYGMHRVRLSPILLTRLPDHYIPISYTKNELSARDKHYSPWRSDAAMFRRPRETKPDRFSSRIGTVLEPLTVIPWAGLAMSYLGVPIAVGVRLWYLSK